MGILSLKSPRPCCPDPGLPVQTKRDWRVFINLPWLLYKNDPYWVPPLKSEMWDTVNQKKNPLMKLGPYTSWPGRVVNRQDSALASMRN